MKKWRLGSLLAAVLVMGCSGKSDVKTVSQVVDADRPKAADSSSPPAVEPVSKAPEATPQPMETSPPAMTAPVKTPPEEPEKPTPPAASESAPRVVVEGAPQPPAAFSGAEETADPPPEVAALIAYSSDPPKDANFDRIVELGLTYPNAIVRRSAAHLLDSFEPSRTEQALLTLRGMTADPNPEVRAAAVMAICAGNEFHDWDIKSAVGELANFLREEDIGRRALFAYQRAGPGAAPATDLLIELVKDKDYVYRGAAIVALGKIGPAAQSAVPVIAEIVANEQDYDAFETLGRLGAIDQLAPLAKHENSSMRQAAIRALGKVAQPTPAVFEMIAAAAKDESSDVREQAAISLGTVRPSTPEIAQQLIGLAADDSSLVRDSAYHGLASLDPPQPVAYQFLLKTIDQLDDHVPVDLLNAVIQDYAGPRAEQVQLTLHIAIIEGGDPSYYFDRHAVEVWPMLKEIAMDPAKPANERAVALFGMLQLAPTLDDPDYDDDADNDLKRPTKEIRAELSTLAKKCLADGEPIPLRGVAIKVLNDCGESIEPYGDLLVAAVQGEGLDEIRRSCLYLAGRMKYAPILPVIVEVLRQNDKRLVATALQGVVRFGAQASDAVPAILPHLEDQGEFNRGNACEALAAIGPAAAAAKDKLTQVSVEDKSDYVQKAAREALLAIEPNATAEPKSDAAEDP